MKACPIWLAFVLPGLCLLAIGIARADEPARPYVITVVYHGKDYDHVQRTHFTLGQPPVVYESKVACDIAITRVRVHLSGAKLQCNPLR